MRRRKQNHPTEDCPHCGEAVRSDASFCPHCGSDASTGWGDAEDLAYKSVDIPDMFGYEDLSEDKSRSWKALLFGIGLILALLAMIRFLFY